jgi:hypothetical protein
VCDWVTELIEDLARECAGKLKEFSGTSSRPAVVPIYPSKAVVEEMGSLIVNLATHPDEQVHNTYFLCRQIIPVPSCVMVATPDGCPCRAGCPDFILDGWGQTCKRRQADCVSYEHC